MLTTAPSVGFVGPVALALMACVELSLSQGAMAMAEPSGIFDWDVGAISLALGMSEDDVRIYFTDGRRVSFILERRIAKALGGQLASSEGAGFDVLDRGGRKWEVRSLTKGGIYFSPSYMVGSGRRFELQGFLSKLADIEGYIVSDITAFPSIPYWTVPVDQVREWWDSGQLGTSTKISRDTARALLRQM